MQKFETLRQPHLWELAMSRKKERKKERGKREKMPFIVATYVYASSQWQRTHSARTNSGQLRCPKESLQNALNEDNLQFKMTSKY
jgi:hypothetical protein